MALRPIYPIPSASRHGLVGGGIITPPPAVTSITVAVLTAFEAETAQPITIIKVRAVGIAAETDAGQAVGKVKYKSVGISTEADAGQALAHQRSRTLGISSETEATLAVGKIKVKAIGISAETEAGQVITAARKRVVGITTETETAQPIRPYKTRTLGVASETETGQALGKIKRKALGISAETDAALVLGQRGRINPAFETETAMPIGRSKKKTVGIALETETAKVIGFMPWVSQSGTNIVAGGKRIKLRGFNVGGYLMWEGWIWGAGLDSENSMMTNLTSLVGATRRDQFISDMHDKFLALADLQAMKALGMNCIRLPFNHTILEDDAAPNVYKQSGWDLLDRILDDCDRAGIYVHLDMHAVPGSQSNTFIADYITGQTLVWSDTAAQTRYTNLWAAIAARYKDRAIIASYDVMNEPAAPTASQAMSLQASAITAIRAVDTNHMVTVEGNNYAHDFSAASVVDSNMAYSFHRYPLDGGNEQTTVQAYIDKAAGDGVPLWVGEWGEDQIGPVELQAERWARNDDIDGFSFWTWKKTAVNLISSMEPAVEIPITTAQTKLMKYLSSTGNPTPTGPEAEQGLVDFINNIQYANCTPHQTHLRDITQPLVGPTLVNDTFTDSTKLLTAHTRDDGKLWVNRTDVSGVMNISNSNRARGNGSFFATGGATATGIPQTGNQQWTSTVFWVSTDGDLFLTLRDDNYNNQYVAHRTPTQWKIEKRIGGSVTVLGTAYSQTATTAMSETVIFKCMGNATGGVDLEIWVGGTLRCSASDSSITAPGRLGLRYTAGVGAMDDTHGPHFADVLGVALLGVAFETETAQALGRRKVRALGTATETEAAQHLGVAHARTLGTASEVEAGQAIGKRKVRALGTATETETAQPVGKSHSRVLGVVAESESALAIGRRHVRALGVVAETQTAQALGRVGYKAVSPATETDSARPLGHQHARVLGFATETNTASAIIRPVGHTVVVSFAFETETALRIRAAKTWPFGVALEDDRAIHIGNGYVLRDVIKTGIIERPTALAVLEPAKVTGELDHTNIIVRLD